MPLQTLEELQRWFDGLDASQRVCRVMVSKGDYVMICGRPAIGIDRLTHGWHRDGLVCDQHKPENPNWFVSLTKGE